MQDIILLHGGKFVSITGKFEKNKIIIGKKSDLKTINTIPVYQLKIDDRIVELKTPIELKAEYDIEYERYILENKQLNIFVANNELTEAIEEFKEQFEILWKEFVEEDIFNLSESAEKFRIILQNIVGDSLK